MKRQSLFYFFLALFLFPALNLSAYNVTQNAVFTPPSNCPGPTITSQDASWAGGGLTLNMTHNIFNVPSSPYYALSVHYQGWRTIFYDIYDVDLLGNEVLEHTIQKQSRILEGGINSGSSSIHYNLDVNDLNAAGLSDGNKVVKVRVRMELGNMLYDVNGEIQFNGVETCDANPLDGSFVECELGVIDCFILENCTAELTVTEATSLTWTFDQNGNPITVVTHRFDANITGGSGDYSYYWVGPGNPGNSTRDYFRYREPAAGWVWVTVTDNVTGCVYRWTNKYGNKMSELDGPLVESLDFQIGPNPMPQGEKLISRFNLNQKDVYSLQIFDVNGKVFLNAQDIPAMLSGEQTLELPNKLAPGIYFVRISSSQMGSNTKRLVVQ